MWVSTWTLNLRTLSLFKIFPLDQFPCRPVNPKKQKDADLALSSKLNEASGCRNYAVSILFPSLTFNQTNGNNKVGHCPSSDLSRFTLQCTIAALKSSSQMTTAVASTTVQRQGVHSICQTPARQWTSQKRSELLSVVLDYSFICAIRIHTTIYLKKKSFKKVSSTSAWGW